MLFENNTFRTLHTRYFTPTIEMKDCNIMVFEEIFFYQSVQSDMRTSENIWKIAAVQWDAYTIGCLLDYPKKKI